MHHSMKVISVAPNAKLGTYPNPLATSLNICIGKKSETMVFSLGVSFKKVHQQGGKVTNKI